MQARRHKESAFLQRRIGPLYALFCLLYLGTFVLNPCRALRGQVKFERVNVENAQHNSGMADQTIFKTIKIYGFN